MSKLEIEAMRSEIAHTTILPGSLLDRGGQLVSGRDPALKAFR